MCFKMLPYRLGCSRLGCCCSCVYWGDGGVTADCDCGAATLVADVVCTVGKERCNGVLRRLAAYLIQGNDCYVDHADEPFHPSDGVA